MESEEEVGEGGKIKWLGVVWVGLTYRGFSCRACQWNPGSSSSKHTTARPWTKTFTREQRKKETMQIIGLLEGLRWSSKRVFPSMQVYLRISKFLPLNPWRNQWISALVITQWILQISLGSQACIWWIFKMYFFSGFILFFWKASQRCFFHTVWSKQL